VSTLKVTLVRSSIGCSERLRATLRGLGLRKLGSSRELENPPAVRGMIKSAIHLLKVDAGSEG